MTSYSGTLTSAQGTRTLDVTPNDVITFTPVSGTYTVEYPIGSILIRVANTTQSITANDSATQLRISCLTGSVAYANVGNSDEATASAIGPVADLATLNSAYPAASNSSKSAYVTGVGEYVSDGATWNLNAAAPVSIVGVTGVGNVLTATLAPGWTATGYQWVRNSTAMGTGVTTSTNISGATSSTYTQIEADSSIVNEFGFTSVSINVTCQVTGLVYVGASASVPAVTIPTQAETTALLARMTVQPSARGAININRLIYALKTAGIWTKLDALWVATIHNAQAYLLNWVSTNFTMVASGAGGTFTPGYGWVSDSSGTGLLTTNFNPTTATTPNFVRDSASFGFYSIESASNGNIFGAFDGTQGNQCAPRGASGLLNIFRVRVNGATALDSPATVLNGQGFFAGNRSGANNVQSYINGTLVASSADNASAALVNQGFAIGRIGVGLTSNGRMAAAYVGGSLTAQQHADFAIAMQTYVNAQLTVTAAGANFASTDQTFIGGYVELQPDSFNGGTAIPSTDSTTDRWGFPYTLTTSERARLKSLLFPGGGKGLQFLRFPLGFAYRGLRNIDGTSGLARNVGERYPGINAAIADLVSNVVAEGGGLAPEYWGVAPHWTTQSKFGGSAGNVNRLWAGGANARSVTLDSIRGSQPAQYAAQIAAFTDAVLNDFEYLHTNIAPVRMWGLQNEPQYGQFEYGSCNYTDQLYSDVLTVLVPKIEASAVLATYGGQPNVPKLHIASDDTFNIGQTYIAANPGKIWSYSHHNIAAIGDDADWVKTNVPTLRGSKPNLFINETEYFTPADNTDQWRCANSMVRDCHNFVYGKALVSMPIIHVAKQIGAAGSNSNTLGYALVEVNLDSTFGTAAGAPTNPVPALDYQTFRPVKANYNAHAFVGENLPVGAVRIGGTITNLPPGVGFAAFIAGGKYYLFLANRNEFTFRLNVTLPSAKTLNGKQYNIAGIGRPIGSVTGTNVTIVANNYSGSVWIEQ